MKTMNSRKTARGMIIIHRHIRISYLGPCRSASRHSSGPDRCCTSSAISGPRGCFLRSSTPSQLVSKSTIIEQEVHSRRLHHSQDGFCAERIHKLPRPLARSSNHDRVINAFHFRFVISSIWLALLLKQIRPFILPYHLGHPQHVSHTSAFADQTIQCHRRERLPLPDACKSHHDGIPDCSHMLDSIAVRPCSIRGLERLVNDHFRPGTCSAI